MNVVQLFIRVHNETLSIVAMCISNENCSTLKIQYWDAALTPTGFAQIVSDDLPVLHATFAPMILFESELYCAPLMKSVRQSAR
jgi:hypothetical protein